jgi:vesicle-associated membrane protein 7
LISYFFHYEVFDGLTFLCLTDEAFGRTMPFLFLEDVKKRFLSEFGNKWKTAIAFSAQTEFGRVLKQLGVRFLKAQNF